MQKSPKVFISYSHDSTAHKEFVLTLANRLRNDGVDCMIDRYVSFPLEGWDHWMEKQLQESDFVLLVCTETYLLKFREEESNQGIDVTWGNVLITKVDKQNVKSKRRVYQTRSSVMLQELTELQKNWDLINKKRFILEEQKILETRGEEKMRLEQLISSTNEEIIQIEQKIDTIESQLPINMINYLQDFGFQKENVDANEPYYDSVNNTCFICLIPDDGSDENIPYFFKDYPKFRIFSEYENLYRELTHQPEVFIPKLGEIKILPQIEKNVKQNQSNIKIHNNRINLKQIIVISSLVILTISLLICLTTKLI